MATVTKRLSGGPAKPVSRKKPFNQVEEVLGVKYLNRVDPDEDFSEVDGDLRGEFALDNEDPQRHYHWAHNNPNDIGQYKGGLLKYRVEYFEDGGVQARMNAGDVKGEAITKRDHVLISCDKAMWQKRNRFEHIETRKTNERMFKRRQSDLDLRDRNALNEEAEEMALAQGA